jgi:hypothetical protein
MRQSTRKENIPIYFHLNDRYTHIDQIQHDKSMVARCRARGSNLKNTGAVHTSVEIQLTIIAIQLDV